MNKLKNVKLFLSQRETIPKYKVKLDQEAANNAGIDIGNLEKTVLYAVTGEELLNDPKINRVLGIDEIDNSAILQQLLVGPRPGTITPWSSKVGDILDGVGIEGAGRVEKVIWNKYDSDDLASEEQLGKIWHDKMTQIIVPDFDSIGKMFEMGEKAKLEYVDILGEGKAALEKFNKDRGAGLSEEYITYLYVLFSGEKRNPTDAEIFSFAQANSEHCYHGTFNGLHTIDGEKQTKSLFSRIRATHAANPNRTISAYKDNAASMKGADAKIAFVGTDGKYDFRTTKTANILKAETHNHPTAISPFPGAATGSGGEIRDEGAVGKGSTPNVGTSGYFVSNLYGTDMRLPSGRVSANQIIQEAPIGAAGFNNEFGRPVIVGDFRVFEQKVGGKNWGYHKPIMLAGGKGNVFPEQIEKGEMPVGTLLIQIGGPSMNIGLGGGAGSSLAAGTSSEKLDFASVQRGNPEMQRRCQESINTCSKMGENNPIVAIHDVGAGGNMNAFSEVVYDSGRGGKIHFDRLPKADPSLSPLETLSNESQERYIVAVDPNNLELISEIFNRENTPFYIIGEITEGRQLVIEKDDGERVFDMDMERFLGNNVELKLTDNTVNIDGGELDFSKMSMGVSIKNVISHPTVGNKSFLVTIGDRTVGGITTQDQMVGSWQTPISNVGVTLHGMEGIIGEVITTGERTPLAVVNPAASCRIAIGESITNLMSAYISDFESIAGSGNWMADKGEPGQLSALTKGVKALEKLCIELGISIPVGKDSLSMKTLGPDGEIVSPLSLITTFTAETLDVTKTVTPELQKQENTELFLIDLGAGKNRMGGSILAQIHNQFGNETPDVDNPELLLGFMKAMRELHEKGLLLAYHDRSDGGLFTTLSEMSFASHLGIDFDLSTLIGYGNDENLYSSLFNEELGAVIQLKREEKEKILAIFEKYGLGQIVHNLGKPNLEKQNISISYGGAVFFDEKRVDLQEAWSETSYKMQKKRDNPDNADQEFARIDDENEPTMPNISTFDIRDHEAYKIIEEAEKNNTPKPKVAVLRTQGINGQIEMARYFDRAGFDAYDVTINDLISGKYNLDDFSGITIAGGFSYGDALGAGVGFASVIKEHPEIRTQFEKFDGFIMGVCNGCQTIAELGDILKGGENFPKFIQNDSTQFEARLSPVALQENSESIFLKGMGGSVLPVISSHGEGKVEGGNMKASLNYVDHNCNKTNAYPHNPNGSTDGATGFELDKIFFMMGHPEREWNPESPWLQIPLNLRKWVEK